MSRIRIVHEPETLPDDSVPAYVLDASIGWGTKLLIDGQELHQVTGIDLRIRTDEVITVTTTVFAGPDLSCELPADVTVNIVPPDVPGWTIVETPLPDGGKRYHVVEPRRALSEGGCVSGPTLLRRIDGSYFIGFGMDDEVEGQEAFTPEERQEIAEQQIAYWRAWAEQGSK